MKAFLVTSFVLILITSCLVIYDHKAFAIPVSYNVTSLSAPFTSYTRAATDLLMESGYNGTVNSLYQGRLTNNTLNYEFGYHPSLPITLDTKNNITASASTAATQSLPLTIASGHNNVAVVVGIIFDHTTNIDHNAARISSVAIGANSFSLLLNKTVTCGAAACDSEIWALGNNTSLTGAQTITITPANTATYHMVAGAYSLYNTRSIRPLDAVSSNTGTSITPSVSITRNFQSGYMLDNVLSLTTGAPSANSDTREWVGHTSVLTGMSQLKLSPASGSNSLTWTTANVQWISTGAEIIPIQNQNNFGYNLAWATSYLSGGSGGAFVQNSSKVYYDGFDNQGTLWPRIMSINVISGVEKQNGTISNVAHCQEANNIPQHLFVSAFHLYDDCGPNVDHNYWVSGIGNFTGGGSGSTTMTNEVLVNGVAGGIWYNGNNTGSLDSRATSTNCVLTFMSSNTTTPIDSIGCDTAIPNHVSHFWNGMYLYKIGNYYVNSTLNFLATVDASAYKKELTIPASIYAIPDPDVKLVGHWNGIDQLVSVSTSKINYGSMPYLITLLNQNRAFQTYDLTLVLTDDHYNLSPSGVSPVQQIKLYGLNGASLNVTVSKYGMIGLPSGYTMRGTATSESVIRTIDPRWSNTPTQDYPAITTQSGLFPIVLTVTNAPSDSALWLTDPAQTINSVNSVWCLTQLDTTHTVECDIPSNQCANVYVGDISVAPTIFIYQGSVCATGTNTKTIQFTNTLPLTFYTLKNGATSSYDPTTNALSTTVRSSTSPFTYNVIIKNSTGAISRNFTTTVNGTIDTHIFNVTNATKPASLYISVAGSGQIYTAYLGSALSLAGASSFFHQYLSYQGFDFLSLIPLVFASMFTRNTVGIGTALVVVCIATLSWLSIVVVPDLVIYISIFVAAIGMIGYRSIYG